jgi:hypothetical protein
LLEKASPERAAEVRFRISAAAGSLSPGVCRFRVHVVFVGEVLAMRRLFQKLFRSEEGAVMVEYGLMVALVAVVCLGAVTTLVVCPARVY